LNFEFLEEHLAVYFSQAKKLMTSVPSFCKNNAGTPGVLLVPPKPLKGLKTTCVIESWCNCLVFFNGVPTSHIDIEQGESQRSQGP